MGNPLLFLALDVPDTHAAEVLVSKAGPNLTHVKVGLELFIAEGRAVVNVMRYMGKTILLDLKLHDIPATVERTVQVMAGFGVDYITVHTAGGKAMLEAAVRGAAGSKIKVLAVTVLTSLDLKDLAAVGTTAKSIEGLVMERACLAKEAGCHGVIASPQEVGAIRIAVGGCGGKFLIFTPGVRLLNGKENKDDQKRVGTARSAIYAGADGIVVGRPIRDAANPAEVVELLFKQMNDAIPAQSI
jgi:orotidine-5'-phosphate decarboxylase